ncbi:hypothetical protein H206_01648 [Candidatus Electrothrix aarhusensis]|jgi:hypothetical protein|uniref:Uncharacterized protein n=1 Tax=Candidatus Electrothrix aarhusensis TaxID=1859131 RepID=A0A3S3QQF3_9BACT|nr:hypothetical protein H206_01648 [Candidatus Electrothrix aarhusensis]
MKNKMFILMLSLLCSFLFVVPGSAFSRYNSNSSDAGKVADYIARSSVKTIYKNLSAEGISWRQIRDQYMPAILARSLKSVRATYSSEVILEEFLPTLITSYYSEIDRINKENSIVCVESSFIVSTLVPFIQACETSLGQWRISVEQVADVVLNISYPYQVCKVSREKSCKNKVQDAFADAFDFSFNSSRFKKVCSDTSWL